MSAATGTGGASVRDDLEPDQRAVFDQAIDNAGRAYAEGLARQAARTPHEAARAALGRHATPAQIRAWISQHRPTAQRDTA